VRIETSHPAQHWRKFSGVDDAAARCFLSGPSSTIRLPKRKCRRELALGAGKKRPSRRNMTSN
jgi:hypothetical protein